MSAVHDRLVARFMVSMQRSQLPFAKHLASCIEADCGIGVALIDHNAIRTREGLAWHLPGIGELAVSRGDTSIGVALVHRRLTPDQARHLAAELLDAARLAETDAAAEARYAARPPYAHSPAPPTDPTNLLELLQTQESTR